MTDNEIIKALKSEADYNCDMCCDNNENCMEDDCGKIISENALDLINRQKAEIERLQKTQSDIDNFARELCKERMLKGKAIADFEDLQEYIRKEKSEAIREFSEKLKQQAYECDIYGRFGKEHFAKAVAVIDINRLVDEMTDGKNG